MQSIHSAESPATATRPAARTLDVDELTVRYGQTLAVDGVTLAIDDDPAVIQQRHGLREVKRGIHVVLDHDDRSFARDRCDQRFHGSSLGIGQSRQRLVQQK